MQALTRDGVPRAHGLIPGSRETNLGNLRVPSLAADVGLVALQRHRPPRRVSPVGGELKDLRGLIVRDAHEPSLNQGGVQHAVHLGGVLIADGVDGLVVVVGDVPNLNRAVLPAARDDIRLEWVPAAALYGHGMVQGLAQTVPGHHAAPRVETRGGEYAVFQRMSDDPVHGAAVNPVRLERLAALDVEKVHDALKARRGDGAPVAGYGAGVERAPAGLVCLVIASEPAAWRVARVEARGLLLGSHVPASNGAVEGSRD